MSMQVITTVIVDLAGQQECVIASAHEAKSAHVQVQVGGVWVTALDREAVAAHAYAWANARAEAADLLPNIAQAKTTPRRQIASLILRQIGFVPPMVYRIPAASKDDRAYIEVHVGSLRVRAYDLAAVESIAEAWERAFSTARTSWTFQPGRLETEAIDGAMKRNGHGKIVQPGLPPAT